MSKDIAIALLQLIALSVPPIAVLIEMLRTSGNLKWRTRKFSFGLAIMSIISFLGAGTSTLIFFIWQFQLNPILQLGLLLAVVGLIPFVLFTGVLYLEHKAQFA